jgi:hypothetical protein
VNGITKIVVKPFLAVEQVCDNNTEYEAPQHLSPSVADEFLQAGPIDMARGAKLVDEVVQYLGLVSDFLSQAGRFEYEVETENECHAEDRRIDAEQVPGPEGQRSHQGGVRAGHSAVVEKPEQVDTPGTEEIEHHFESLGNQTRRDGSNTDFVDHIEMFVSGTGPSIDTITSFLI